MRHHRIFCLLTALAWLCLYAPKAGAQDMPSPEEVMALTDEPTDSLPPSATSLPMVTDTDRREAPGCRLQPQQVVAPAIMLAMGAVAVANPKLCRTKENVRSGFLNWRGGHRKLNIETWVSFSAPIISIAADRGRPRHSFLDRMMVKATSYALLYSVGPITRRCVHETRPDGHGKHAFPSMKTASAFMTAEQMRIERGWGWGMMGYGVAAGVGVLQLYNDRCYINDVVAGAGMGILCTHAAYWLLPLERRWLGLDKRKTKRGNKKRGDDTQMVLVPTYDYSTQTLGMAFTAEL